jgi:hypothetical protein
LVEGLDGFADVAAEVVEGGDGGQVDGLHEEVD